MRHQDAGRCRLWPVNHPAALAHTPKKDTPSEPKHSKAVNNRHAA